MISFCTDDIPAVNVWLGSSTSLFEKLVAHELTHSIAAVNYTSTQGDIDNWEIMRPAVYALSNYWNVDFTINPFWDNVNLTSDCVNAIMLPITLSDFSVKAHFGTSHLSWTPVSETNNAYFTVERSGDGKDFYEIGVLPGAGNSTSERHYSFTDEQPTNGINYYRIRQIDFDGKYSYSHVESVRFSNSIADIEFISPNPVHRFSSITLDDQNDMSAVRIFNSQGMELSFRRESKNIYIDYVPGIYYLISYSGSKAIRFVVME